MTFECQDDVHMIVAVIPARAASKGLPNKNLQPLGGHPLIAHSIRCARAVPGIERVVVTTSSPAIADVARHYGAEVPFLRPEVLAQDDTPMLPILQHAVAEIERAGVSIRAVALLQPTSLLRALQPSASSAERSGSAIGSALIW